MPYDIVIGRDKEDREKFGDKGLIFIGKGYVKMGNYTSLSNRLWLDVARSHVILVAGKRGSGKSYSLGVIAEEMTRLPKDVKENIAGLIFDTMGIFWTMKFKNDKDIEELDEWNLKSENLPVTIWVPSGYFEEFEKRKIPVDNKFALEAYELDVEDWLSIFRLKMIDSISIIIQKVISNLKEKGAYDLDDIIDEIDKNKTDEINKKSAISLFEAAQSWKVFAKKGEKGTKVEELIESGKTSVLDLSMYSSVASFNVRALIIGLISKKLFVQRMLARKKEETDSIYYGVEKIEGKKEMPLVWIF